MKKRKNEASDRSSHPNRSGQSAGKKAEKLVRYLLSTHLKSTANASHVPEKTLQEGSEGGSKDGSQMKALFKIPFICISTTEYPFGHWDVCLPREARLPRLGPCSYDLGFDISRGKVFEMRMYRCTGQQLQPVALEFRLRRVSIANLHCLHGEGGHHFRRRRCPSLDAQAWSPGQVASLILSR